MSKTIQLSSSGLYVACGAAESLAANIQGGTAGLPMQLMSDEDEDHDEDDGEEDGNDSDLPSSSAADSDDSDEFGELLCCHICYVQIMQSSGIATCNVLRLLLRLSMCRCLW